MSHFCSFSPEALDFYLHDVCVALMPHDWLIRELHECEEQLLRFSKLTVKHDLRICVIIYLLICLFYFDIWMAWTPVHNLCFVALPLLSTSSSSHWDFNQTLSWSNKLVSAFISRMNMSGKRVPLQWLDQSLCIDCFALSVNAVARTFFLWPETNLAIDCSETLINKD